MSQICLFNLSPRNSAESETFLILHHNVWFKAGLTLQFLESPLGLYLSDCTNMMFMSHCGISVVINVRLYDTQDEIKMGVRKKTYPSNESPLSTQQSGQTPSAFLNKDFSISAALCFKETWLNFIFRTFSWSDLIATQNQRGNRVVAGPAFTSMRGGVQM